MKSQNKTEPVILFLGDIVALYAALWLSLFLRGLEIPSAALFEANALAFSFLFVVWFIAFFIAGLYEKHTLIVQKRLSSIILKTQIVNSAIGIAFFYFIPLFSVSPKTVLFINLIVSFALIVLWRIAGKNLFLKKKKQLALIVGEGDEVSELIHEVNNNRRYDLLLEPLSLVTLSKEELVSKARHLIKEHNIKVIITDIKDPAVEPLLKTLYSLMFQDVTFLSIHEFYEQVFDRIPLTLLRYDWFIENISTSPKYVYEFFKRTIDVLCGLILGAISLIFYPFVYIAIKLDDGGPMFLYQERIGKDGKTIQIVKIRTMKAPKGDSGAWVGEGDNRITRVGKYLRKSRIDELPQLWNLLFGDISLIGPRPDLVGLGLPLFEQIPYYAIRTLVTPGLSGWAQIKQDLPPQSVEETKIRLAYDFFYIKNRSILLDIKIMLQTVKTLLSRTGL